MRAPIFLTLDEALALHADQVHRYGGGLGVRDAGLLESALAVPRASFRGTWLHESLAAMAAAYLFHIVRNHPFIDGNKRAGLMATLVFLGLNGLALEAGEDELTNLVLGVASRQVSKAEATVFIERHARPRTAS